MIHVKELFRLQGVRRLRLIAGQAGLERRVRSAVLFEYDAARMDLSDFYKGDLVLSTLEYAREDAALVSCSLLSLIAQGVSALMIKTGYYTELPAAVCEEVLLEVTELIRGRHHFSGYEHDLDELMHGGLSGDQIREKVWRIDPSWSGPARVYALAAKQRAQTLGERLFAFTEEAGESEDGVIMSWRWLLLVLSHPKADEKGAYNALDRLLTRAGILPETVIVGASAPCSAMELIGQALCEAIYAVRTAQVQRKERITSDEMGLFAYLLPMSENPFICAQCRAALELLRSYDRQNHASLEQTAREVVHSNLEIVPAARALYQHPNTVRYRLTKIRSLLGIERESDFMLMLSLIVGLTDILEDEALG